ncbi:vegetative cell wall protein gp1 [Nilaparvata lugens]|uniref:vegetative cell wall protein gp1 n=1 Tax=Nilaparvata lugens TaxID=108931 RepID=UPI00193EA088|nr:vegetative cell wall protein gp1 [Nilaparvata lugens]
MERNASTSYPSPPPPHPDSPPPPYSELTPVTHRSVTPSSPLYRQFPPQYSFQPPRPLSPQDTPTSRSPSIFEPSRPSTPPSPSMIPSSRARSRMSCISDLTPSSSSSSLNMVPPTPPLMMDVRCVSQAQRRALIWLKANLNLVPNYFQRLLDDSDSDEEDPTDHRNRYIAICPV